MVQAEYVYNAQGQQVIRRVPANREDIHSIHDLDGNRIAEYNYNSSTGVTTLLREYVWLEGRAIAVIEGGVTSYIRTDNIGRPVFATDGAGTKVWEATYLPFGGVQSSSAGTINLRFPGQWFQSESGLHQNWMRDYDPTTGRYIQADPLGIKLGPAMFVYAQSSPQKYVDPDGRNPLLFAILEGAIKPAVKKLIGKRITKVLLKRGIACVGKARDNFMGLNCPASCPKRVIGVGFTRGQACESACKTDPLGWVMSV